jgi:anti-sigma regulatory factor (Ser/Thr protein kinase)
LLVAVGDRSPWVKALFVEPRPPAPETMRVTRSFEPRAHEVRAARHFVMSTLEAWHLAPADVPLLVSELATNAVLHARSDFAVTIVAREDRIRVEVFDHNARLPSPTAVPAEAYSGRGLMILQGLSSAWGVETHAGIGKTIWFEVMHGTDP